MMCSCPPCDSWEEILCFLAVTVFESCQVCQVWSFSEVAIVRSCAVYVDTGLALQRVTKALSQDQGRLVAFQGGG
jgi:hypothetical protein